MCNNLAQRLKKYLTTFFESSDYDITSKLYDRMSFREMGIGKRKVFTQTPLIAIDYFMQSLVSVHIGLARTATNNWIYF